MLSTTVSKVGGPVLRLWVRFPSFAFIVISLLLGCVKCMAQSATAEASSLCILPSHTPVILRLDKNLSKSDAKPGQSVQFEVAYDVVVCGQVVIQSGTAVEGGVRQVERSGKGPAKVLVDLGPAQTIPGEIVRLVWSLPPTSQSSGGIADVVGWGAETGPLLPALVIASLFEKKLILGEGAYGVAVVAEDVALNPAGQKAAQEQYTASRKTAQVELCELLASRDSGNAGSRNQERINELARRVGLDDSSKADLLRRAGDLDGAIDVYNQLLTSKRDFPCPVTYWPFYPYLGNAQALPTELREQLSMQSSATLHLSLAELLREKRDFVGAISEYRIAVQLDPTASTSRIGLVNALQDSGNLDGAIAEVKEAVRIWPDAPYFHYLLGRALIKKDDADAAIVELRVALQGTKNHFSPANCELGRAYEKKGDPGAALRQYRIAIRAHGGDEECHAAYERLQHQLKN